MCPARDLWTVFVRLRPPPECLVHTWLARLGRCGCRARMLRLGSGPVVVLGSVGWGDCGPFRPDRNLGWWVRRSRRGRLHEVDRFTEPVASGIRCLDRHRRACRCCLPRRQLRRPAGGGQQRHRHCTAREDEAKRPSCGPPEPARFHSGCPIRGRWRSWLMTVKAVKPDQCVLFDVRRHVVLDIGRRSGDRGEQRSYRGHPRRPEQRPHLDGPWAGAVVGCCFHGVGQPRADHGLELGAA